ncbi:MAG: hypothetical protein U0640_15520 [Phycisphaerales bacterium]
MLELLEPPAENPTPAPAPEAKAEAPMHLEVQTDCVALPMGYKALGTNRGFAITLSPRAVDIPDAQLDALIKDNGANIDCWPAGLCLWCSGIVGINLFLFAPGADKPSKCIEIDFAANNVSNTLTFEGVNDRTLLVNDLARTPTADVHKHRWLIERLESNLFSFMQDQIKRVKLDNTGPNGTDEAAVRKAIRKSLGVREGDNNPGTASEVDASPDDSRKEPKPHEHWSFGAYCLDVARQYPLNTAAHLGFVVHVRQQDIASFLESGDVDHKGDWKEGVRVIAVPRFGVLEGSSGSYSLRAEHIKDYERAHPEKCLHRVSADSNAYTCKLESREKVPENPPRPTLTISAEPRECRLKDDADAVLDMNTLLVRCDGNLSADGEWLTQIEPAVHRSFALANHLAAQWPSLWETHHYPEKRIALIRDWCSLLRDLTGLSAWRDSKEKFLIELGFPQNKDVKKPTTRKEMKEAEARQDAASRYAWLLPEVVLHQVQVLAEVNNQTVEASKFSDARNSLATREKVSLESWAVVLQSAFTKTKRQNKLVSLLPKIVSDKTGYALDDLCIDENANPVSPREITMMIREVAEAFENDDVLTEIILSEWVAADTDDDRRARVVELLRPALSSFREGTHARSLSALVRRSLAAPFWDRSVDLITKNNKENDKKDDKKLATATLRAVSESLWRRHKDSKVDEDSDFGRVEQDIMFPELEGTLAIRPKGDKEDDVPKPPAWLEEAVSLTCHLAEHPASSTDSQIRPAGEEPQGVTMRVDRLSSSKPVTDSDPTIDNDFARRLSGFGVLVRRIDKREKTPWSCVNIARHGIPGINQVSNEYALGLQLQSDKQKDREIARIWLMDWHKNSEKLFDPQIHPLRLGFVNGLRQTTFTYNGRSLLGASPNSAWAPDLNKKTDANEDTDASKEKNVEENPPPFASPMFWYAPVLPLAKVATTLQKVPAMLFGSTYEFQPFAMLNCGVLPEKLASDKHVCVVNSIISNDFAKQHGSIRHERSNTIAAPELRALMRSAPFGASCPAAVALSPKDSPVKIFETDITDLSSLSIAIPPLDTQRESGQDEINMGGALPCEIMLTFVSDKASHKILIARKLAKIDGLPPKQCFVTWSIKVDGNASIDVKNTDGKIAACPLDADVSLRIASYGKEANVIPASAELQAILRVEWDDVEKIEAVQQRGGTLKGTRIALERRNEVVVESNAPNQIQQFHTWVRSSDAPIVNSEKDTFNPSIAANDQDTRWHVQAVVMRPNTDADEKLGVLIAHPQIRLGSQATNRGELSVAMVERTADMSAGDVEIRAPRTSLECFMRWRTDLNCEKRRALLLVDRLLRSYSHSANKVDTRTRGSLQALPDEHPCFLQPADPAIKGYVVEIVPLFKPNGRQAKVERKLVNPTELTLNDVVSTLLKITENQTFKDLKHDLKTAGFNNDASSPLGEAGEVFISSNVLRLCAQKHDGPSKLDMTSGEDFAGKILVGMGEVVDIRVYPMLAFVDNDVVSEHVTKCTKAVVESLRQLAVGDQTVIVGEATSMRLAAAPDQKSLAAHMPLKAELLSCLRPRFEESVSSAGKVIRKVLLDLDVPRPMARRFAYASSIQARRQQWMWRGEVFERGGRMHPWPKSTATHISEQDFFNLPDGLARIEEVSPFERWESLAAANHPESAFESREVPVPWNPSRLELLSHQADDKASIHRLGAQCNSFVFDGKSKSIMASIGEEVEADAGALEAIARNAGLPTCGHRLKQRKKLEVDEKLKKRSGDGPDVVSINWKRVFLPARRTEPMPMPKLWLVLPLSRNAARWINQPGSPKERAQASITSALVLTIGGGYDHAGWEEDIQCAVSTVDDTSFADGKTKVIRQYDVGSVPSSTSKAFPSIVENPQPDKYTPAACALITAGPVGHSFDPPDANDPMISASSYIVDLSKISTWIEDTQKTQFEKALDSRVRFRRVLRTSPEEIANPLKEWASEWTPPVLLRCGIDTSGLASALGLERAVVVPKEKLDVGGTFKSATLRFSSEVGANPVELLIAHAARSNYRLWVLLTRVLEDEVTDGEDFLGIAALHSTNATYEFDIAMAGKVRRGSGIARARVMLVNADIGAGGQAQATIGQSKSASLMDIAEWLMPWNPARFERDPWNMKESIARITSISEPCNLQIALTK